MIGLGEKEADMKRQDRTKHEILTKLTNGKSELSKMVRNEKKRKKYEEILNQLLNIGIKDGKYPKAIRVYSKELTLEEVRSFLKSIIQDVEVEELPPEEITLKYVTVIRTMMSPKSFRVSFVKE